MRLYKLIPRYYKCFSEGTEVGPFGKVNVFIGKNNSGKSHLVKAIRRFPGFAKPATRVFSKQDYYEERENLDIALTYVWVMNCGFVEHLAKEGLSEAQANLQLFRVIEEATDMPDYGVFVMSRITKAGWGSAADDSVALTIKQLNENMKPDFRPGVAFSQAKIRAAVGFIDEYLRKTFGDNFFDLPDLRRIEKGAPIKDKGFIYTTDGKNLVKQLYDFERPKFGDPKKGTKRRQFEIVLNFLRELMDDDTLEIQPDPSEEDAMGGEIQVESKKTHHYIREIRELGYGITELVLFATGISHLYRGIITLEEPENHLHPETIKKLLKYITRPEDKNQYFIATHSNALLDFSPDIKVFRVEHNGEFSTVSSVDNYDKAFKTLFDMGYTPSDILQSNFVIWVEGPSDRIFIKKWLELFYDEHKSELFEGDIALKEGLHYSFAATGGSCLKHYTVDINDTGEAEQEVETFLNIVNLGRNCAVVLDSDKNDESGPLKDTTMRIKEEVNKAERICWVTWGKTIENYVSKEVRKAVITNKRHTWFSKPPEDRVRKAHAMAKLMSYKTEFVNNDSDLPDYVRDLLIGIGRANNFPQKKDENRTPVNGGRI